MFNSETDKTRKKGANTACLFCPQQSVVCSCASLTLRNAPNLSLIKTLLIKSPNFLRKQSTIAKRFFALMRCFLKCILVAAFTLASRNIRGLVISSSKVKVKGGNWIFLKRLSKKTDHLELSLKCFQRCRHWCRGRIAVGRGHSPGGRQWLSSSCQMWCFPASPALSCLSGSTVSWESLFWKTENCTSSHSEQRSLSVCLSWHFDSVTDNMVDLPLQVKIYHLHILLFVMALVLVFWEAEGLLRYNITQHGRDWSESHWM